MVQQHVPHTAATTLGSSQDEDKQEDVSHRLTDAKWLHNKTVELTTGLLNAYITICICIERDTEHNDT